MGRTGTRGTKGRRVASACSSRRRIRPSSLRLLSRFSAARFRSRRRWRRRWSAGATFCASRRSSTRSGTCCSASMPRFVYRDDVLRALLVHGVRPTDSTPPEVARDFVRDLYKYQIRQLRKRYLRGEFPKHEYSDRVETLRRTYPVL